ncbi:glutathione S-transferase N-terminal domain-containing protein [Prochlorococcus marinus]|uniref:glutathione S-transferase N-terminal domain-containing protein n=1 Tax=Prochlorococcus marinus TaxID=1219 RepID=UPI0022B54A80|nr:glutathione S-transferase N-terminal domain-containing protein [Prochlorococcus marinus]
MSITKKNNEKPINNILYSFRRCPYAMRARWALLKADQQVILREVNLKDKPIELINNSKNSTVPLLVLESGVILNESIDIIYWADNIIRIKNGLIKQKHPYQQEINLLLNQNDLIFKFHLDRYKYPNRFPNCNPKEHLIESEKILQEWNERLGKSSKKNSKAWLIGDKESIADYSLWPFVRQFRLVNQEYFDNNIKFKYLKVWLDFYLNHKLFSVLMKKYKFWNRESKEVLFPSE